MNDTRDMVPDARIRPIVVPAIPMASKIHSARAINGIEYPRCPSSSTSAMIDRQSGTQREW